MESPKVVGWDITLFRKKYFMSTTRLNVIATVVSIPFMYNIYHVVSSMREKKKETGKIKLTPSDALRLFGVDFACITTGLITYFVLKRTAGLSIVSRYLSQKV